MTNDIPSTLKHKPIVYVNYSDTDGSDAIFLSLGRATWDNNVFSAKIWRWVTEKARWSRLSEDIPLYRLLDLTKLLICFITGQNSSLPLQISDTNRVDSLRNCIVDDDYLMQDLEEIHTLLKNLFDND